MRSPSSRCLANTVTVYRYSPSQDEDAGATFNQAMATILAKSVLCSVQPTRPEANYGEGQDRVSQVNQYTVIFPSDYGVNIKDVIVWVDGTTTRTLSVVGSANWAGQSAAWGVSAREII